MNFRSWIPGSNPGKIILLVDDNRENLLMLQIRLRSVGCTILCASDGMEALEVYHKAKEHIVLIITDNQMPNMTGAELLLNLKRSGEKVPVMMVSANSSTNTVLALIQEGLDGYLPRPFSPDEFVSVVNSLLMGARD